MPTEPNAVSFSVDDAVKIAQSLGGLLALVNPASAGAVAIGQGAVLLLRNVITPAIAQWQSHNLSIVEQATLEAESALERIRVGAPPAVTN